MIRIGHRFMTGQVCTTTGDYEFDGYTDGSPLPRPSDDEKRITINASKPFPPATPGGKRSYWRFMGPG